jgi:hypothetical protein
MAELQELSRKTCFTLEDVAQSLGMQTHPPAYCAAAMSGRGC